MTYFIPKGTMVYRTKQIGWPCEGWIMVESVRDVTYEQATETAWGGNHYYLFQLPDVPFMGWAQFCVLQDHVKIRP